MLTPRDLIAAVGVTSFPKKDQTALEARAEAILRGELPASQMPELPPLDGQKTSPETD